MAQPTPYNRQNSFTLLAQEDPSEPYTGADLDEEFNSVKVTLDQVLERLVIIQRDDGSLQNGVVSVDSLGFSFALGIEAPVAWETGATYTTRSTVFNGVKLYRANVAHTAAALFATDSAKWDELADLTNMLAEGIGTTELEDEAVTTAKLGPSAVTAVKLATNAVATANIQDEAATLAKMANLATDTLIGRTSSGTGVPEAVAFTDAGQAMVAAASAAAQFTLIKQAATTSATGVVQLGKHSIWIPASAMVSRLTNGAANGLVEMTTNKNMFVTKDFDTTTQEFAQFSIRMPKSWDLGTVTFVPVWSHPSTTTNFGVCFTLAGVAISNDDAGDVAFGTGQGSVDTGGTTNDVYQGPESSAITIAGTPAEGDLVMFQIDRTTGNPSDDLAVDARLHGILLLYTANAARDD